MKKIDYDINNGILLALRVLCSEDLHEVAMKIVDEHTTIENLEKTAERYGYNYDFEVVRWLKSGHI